MIYEIPSVKKPMIDSGREFLAKKTSIDRFRKLRKSVMSFAKAESFFSDEDVFEVVS